MKPLNLIEKKFGRLIVIKKQGKYKKHTLWLCKCDCGKETIVSNQALRTGRTHSCGCLRKELMTVHGWSRKRKRLYSIWINMKARCRDKNRKNYKNYGARGIKVCKEWAESFISFRNWALASSYQDNLTIDRINNDGNYEPDNCQWLTRIENIKKGDHHADISKF